MSQSWAFPTTYQSLSTLRPMYPTVLSSYSVSGAPSLGGTASPMMTSWPSVPISSLSFQAPQSSQFHLSSSSSSSSLPPPPPPPPPSSSSSSSSSLPSSSPPSSSSSSASVPSFAVSASTSSASSHHPLSPASWGNSTDGGLFSSVQPGTQLTVSTGPWSPNLSISSALKPNPTPPSSLGGPVNPFGSGPSSVASIVPRISPVGSFVGGTSSPTPYPPSSSSSAVARPLGPFTNPFPLAVNTSRDSSVDALAAEPIAAASPTSANRVTGMLMASPLNLHNHNLHHNHHNHHNHHSHSLSATPSGFNALPSPTVPSPSSTLLHAASGGGSGASGVSTSRPTGNHPAGIITRPVAVRAVGHFSPSSCGELQRQMLLGGFCAGKISTPVPVSRTGTGPPVVSPTVSTLSILPARSSAFRSAERSNTKRRRTSTTSLVVDPTDPESIGTGRYSDFSSPLLTNQSVPFNFYLPSTNGPVFVGSSLVTSSTGSFSTTGPFPAAALPAVPTGSPSLPSSCSSSLNLNLNLNLNPNSSISIQQSSRPFSFSASSSSSASSSASSSSSSSSSSLSSATTIPSFSAALLASSLPPLPFPSPLCEDEDHCGQSPSTNGGDDKSAENGSGDENDEDRPFQCSWANCDRRFKKRFHLNRHLRIHTGEKTYECEVDGCGRRFARSDMLLLHMRIHNGDRRHQCNVCGKSFYVRSSLASHMLSHGMELGSTRIRSDS